MKNKSALIALSSSLIAIIVGLLIGFIIICVVNPGSATAAFSVLLQGGFYKGIRSTGEVLFYAVPVMMTGLSVAFAFKCGVFNIGAPGQYIVGAFTAIAVCTFGDAYIPVSVLWLVALIAGGLAGAIWAIVPGVLKAYCNVNVVISCIMMNYIGMLLVVSWVKKYLYNLAGAESVTVPASKAVPTWGLDTIFVRSNVNIGIFIAIGLCILAHIILNKTTFGFELKAVGYNPEASRYAGMNEKKCIIISMMIAGFFAGIGGALAYTAGTGKAISTAEVLASDGFTGISIALLGFNNPLGVICAALFISYIEMGGYYMQAFNIPLEIIDVIVACIIYCSAFSLFIRKIIEKFIEKKGKGGNE